MKRIPRYLPLVLALAETLPRTPGVHHVVVRHDDGCPRLADPPGECACEPEIDAPEDAS